MPNETDQFRWLLTDEAANFLEDTRQQLLGNENILRLVKNLRKQISPEKSALVVELAQLRIRARKKFVRANDMFFTGRSLEMATDQRISQFKAQRFIGMKSAADVCCSIGGDLIGLASVASNCEFTGFDSDPVAAAYCRKNLSCYGIRSEVDTKTFEEIDFTRFDAIHIDPERRKNGRSTRGDLFSPTLSEIIERSSGKNTAIKVAPATRMQDSYPVGIERQWIGHSRECKQQVIWTGDFARFPGCRSAIRLGKSGSVTEFHCEEEQANNANPIIADTMHKYFYEPHNVVLAAGLANALFTDLSLERVSNDAAYATCETVVDNKLVSRFRVLDWLPANIKHVSVALKNLNVGKLEVKHRCVPEFVVNNYRKIKLSGTEKGSLILSPFGQQRIAVISKRETAV